jgi:hypothetical protein
MTKNTKIILRTGDVIWGASMIPDSLVLARLETQVAYLFQAPSAINSAGVSSWFRVRSCLGMGPTGYTTRLSPNGRIS